MPESNAVEPMLAYLQGYARCVADVVGRLPWEELGRVAEALHQARLCRAQVFVCGNGGSAATASHMVNDLNKGAIAPGLPRFRALSLVDNIPLLMAWSNDASYVQGIAEPLRNLARPGDLLVGISYSGRSANVLAAVNVARQLGLHTIGFTGSPGDPLAARVDLPLRVPSGCVEQVEDVHLLLEHGLVSALRDRATREKVPSLLLADGRGATPESPTVAPDLPLRPAILLDRDGVIIANRADYVKSWDEVELLPGAIEALRRLAHTGWPIVVVTNQSAIGRGAVDFDVVESINLRLMRQATALGGRIDATIWCPHRPEEGCTCRKPAPGMLTYAAASLALDLGRSYMVGDAASDVAAGEAVGAQTALVLSGRGAEQRAVAEARASGCRALADLGAAAEWIMADLAMR